MEKFNPSGYAVKNNNFIGLPFKEETAKIILQPVPWEATVSYSAGTGQGSSNILDASYQLDLYDTDYPNAYEVGIFMRQPDPLISSLSDESRQLAIQHIDHLEAGLGSSPELIAKVNQNSQKVNNWVYRQCSQLLRAGKFVGLVGGEHSVPLGYLKALSEQYGEFGILQFDAHADLRKAYEDFTYSHASIFYNVMEEIPQISQLTQVGVRDYCHEEVAYAASQGDRIQIFYDHLIKHAYFEGYNYDSICKDIIKRLPQKVYISFDIDALQPGLCPGTGTPVPGGFDIPQSFYLLKKVVDSGRQIIGFDLCEVGSTSEWDGNVGARVAYKLCALLAKSQGL